MIVVHNEFHVDPVKIKQATEAAKAAQAVIGKLGQKPHQILTDVTGEFYTIMFVGEFESLAALEQTMQTVMSNPDFQKAYQPLRDAIRSGSRRILRVIG
jgi:hypothetical protein